MTNKYGSESNKGQVWGGTEGSVEGHVVHHLFFEKVPHYRLEEATKALVKGLEERGEGHLYKNIETHDFSQEIVKQFNDNWFFVNEKQIVR